MLNAEYWKNQIDSINSDGIAVVNDSPVRCRRRRACEGCDLRDIGPVGTSCVFGLIKWLIAEHKEPKIDWDSDIDWARVPVDTEVLIKLSEGDEWIPAYFALYVPQKMMPYVVFTGGDKRDTAISISGWICCKLVNPDDIEKYRRKQTDERQS